MAKTPETIFLDQDAIGHIANCTKSFPYFLQHACYFQGPGGPLPPSAWTEPQLKIAKEFQENPEVIVLKSRQCGMSWVLAAYSFWKSRFNAHSRSIILSTTEVAAKKLKQRINFIYDQMPKYLTSTLGVNNVESMEFKELNSYISCLSSAPTSSRGETVALVILDEFAFMEKADQIWNAVRFTAAHGGQVIISSTPNGVGNEFHRIWSDAVSGLNQFKNLTLHYSELPFYTEDKIKMLKMGSNDDMWKQEMECKFNLSGRPVFNADDVDAITGHPLKEPTIGETFAGGIDPSDGAGDFTAITVLSAQWREVHSEVHRKPLVEGIEYVKGVIEKYPGIWIIERNNHGHAYLKDLRQYFQYNPKVSILEFTTSSKSKPMLFNNLARAVEKHELMLNSKVIKSEMMTLQYISGINSLTTHIQAFSGYHDDAVMSLALALRATSYMQYQPETGRGDMGVVQIGSVDPWA